MRFGLADGDDGEGMSGRSLVSAVIPVYNGEQYIAEAIRSVLEQTRPVMECIVVDDGSVDGTAEATRSFGANVTYVRQENAGVALARNRGAALASGELIAFLDHDDSWLPNKLERQLEVADDDVTMITCATVTVDAEGIFIGEHRMRVIEDLLVGMLTFNGTEVPSCSSTGLVRRVDFHRLGGFDPRLGTSADWDFLLNVLLRGTLQYVDEPLVRYRVHASSMSRDVVATERDMRYAFAKAFSDPALPDGVRRIRRRAYGRLFRMLAGSYRVNGDMPAALRAGAVWLMTDPIQVIRESRS